MIYTSHYWGEQIGKSLAISVYPPKEFDFDKLPLFTPSDKLLKFWTSSRKDADAQKKYTEIFLEEMRVKDQFIDVWLHKVKGDLTLNCYKEKFCHRHIVGEIIKAKKPNLWGGEVETIKQSFQQTSLFPEIEAPVFVPSPIPASVPVSPPLSSYPKPAPRKPRVATVSSISRYTWPDAPNWWNPFGEEISQDLGDRVILAYGGRLIPKSDLILVANENA
jgi:hypothetical protein